MRPLTDATPKPLLKIKGKPLIEWHIERLRDAGYTELVVNVSWLKEQLIHFLGDGSRFGVHIDISEEPTGALETAGGIVQALPILGDRFLVVNGDIWTDLDFASLHEQPQRDDVAHLVLVPNPDHHSEGDFVLADGRVCAEGKERLTFSGIGVYRKELFAGLPPGVRKLAPLLRQAMAQDRVSGQLYGGAWSDIGTPERLSRFSGFYAE